MSYENLKLRALGINGLTIGTESGDDGTLTLAGIMHLLQMTDALTVTPQFILAHILYDIIQESQQFLLIFW